MRKNQIMSKVFYSKLIGLCLMVTCLVFGSIVSNAQTPTIRVTTRAVTGNLPSISIPGVLNDPNMPGYDPRTMTESFCGGTMINVPFEVESINDGRLLSSNVFMVEISEPDGSFLPENDPRRRLFGTLPGRTSGTLFAKLPGNLPFSTKYKVRVVTSPNSARLGTQIQYVSAVTDSTRPYNVAVFPKPCFSAESKAINCYSTLTVRVNPSCSFGRCNCPGTDPNLPIIDQNYYRVELVDYPVDPQNIVFDYNNFTYSFLGLPTGWYTVRVSDRYSCDSTINFFHVSSPARPITTLTINNITYNTAIVTWTDVNNTIPNGAGTSYDLRYRQVEETFPDTTPVPFPSPNTHAIWTQINNIQYPLSGAPTATLFPLQPNTRYEVQVRSVCYDPNTRRVESSWSASKFFETTQIPTPVDQNCRMPGGIYVRYTNTTVPNERGRIFFNLDPNNQATCYEVQYGPVYSDDNDPYRVSLDWSHPSYVVRHYSNQRFVTPAQVLAGIPVMPKATWKDGQLMRIHVRANCSLNCAQTQMNLSEWSRDVFFRLPPPRLAGNGVIAEAAYSVYPNPTKGQFTLNYTSQDEGSLSFNIVDIMGKTVVSDNVAVTAGDNEVSIDLTSFAKGIYLLQLNNGENLGSVKVVVE
jgi:hypothetical protein